MITFAISRYNIFMLRGGLLTVLIASVLTGIVQPPQAVATSTGLTIGLLVNTNLVGQHSGPTSQRGIPSRIFFSRFHIRPHGSLLPYYVAHYQPSWYQQSESAETPTSAVGGMAIQQHEDVPAATREKPLPKSQVIDIPSTTISRAAKSVAPTIFILINGERLESRRFLLSARNLSITVDGQHRTIPLEMVDLDATKAANRQRGIDLRIPADHNEIVLSF